MRPATVALLEDYGVEGDFTIHVKYTS
jgi:hypothetical protein